MYKKYYLIIFHTDLINDEILVEILVQMLFNNNLTVFK